ncbi:MAG TPA: hypothetical protein PK544_13410 [Spirochaetota bacterium]|nr:hypothetical protein [Spirochaetota bacterium]HPQ54023.1 hypothetical protein [Spirochaetota bacterium]
MRRPVLLVFLFIAMSIFHACSLQKLAPGIKSYKEPSGYNVKFKAYTVNISNPEIDRRCYYKVFIDKIEAGRTSTGLESQVATFTAKLSVNRHLIKVQKWVLKHRSGSYEKLNNVDQPRPDFLYFDVPENRIVVITLVSDAVSGRSMFGLDFEYD